MVLDNLNVHTTGAFYEAFEPATARAFVKRIEFVFAPKHGSWLGAAEYECSRLQAQVAAWADSINAKLRGVDWQFQIDEARTKFARFSPRCRLGNAPNAVFGVTLSACGFAAFHSFAPQADPGQHQTTFDGATERLASELHTLMNNVRARDRFDLESGVFSDAASKERERLQSVCRRLWASRRALMQWGKRPTNAPSRQRLSNDLQDLARLMIELESFDPSGNQKAAKKKIADRIRSESESLFGTPFPP